MKQRFIFIVALALLPWSLIADDWGKNGHRAVGEIAEKYLSEKTKKAISELLDGHSLAFVSNYGDDIKSDRNGLGQKQHNAQRSAKFNSKGAGDEVIITATTHPQIGGDGRQ